jgi:enolase
VIPRERAPREAVRVAREVYSALRGLLIDAKGRSSQSVGDEGGFAPEFSDDLEPLRFIRDAAKKAGHEDTIDVGIDAAAENIKLDAHTLTEQYEKMIQEYHPIYIEDPYGEEQFEEFAKLCERAGEGVFITGDDLTTTNVSRMERANDLKSVNAVIIKPNQIGTVSEALDAVSFAKDHGWGVVVSHRSGETNDDFIADFAVGVSADGFKLGAPQRGERIAKYNRLLDIERTG